MLVDVYPGRLKTRRRKDVEVEIKRGFELTHSQKRVGDVDESNVEHNRRFCHSTYLFLDKDKRPIVE